MRSKCDAEGNRAKVMSTDTVLMWTDTTFCVTIYWGCCAGCTCRVPQNYGVHSVTVGTAPAVERVPAAASFLRNHRGP